MPNSLIVDPTEMLISGLKSRKFSYNPGDHPYSFRISDGRRYIQMTGILFANDEDHVRTILEELTAFIRECRLEYLHSEGQAQYGQGSAFVLLQEALQLNPEGALLEIEKVDRSQIISSHHNHKWF